MNELLTTGNAIHSMLKDVDIDGQIAQLSSDIKSVKSVSKRDAMIKQLKYLAGLRRMNLRPEDAYVINHIPVVPPIVRPTVEQSGNRIKFADVNNLYKDHFLVNSKIAGMKEEFDDEELIEARRDAYDGVKAIFGLGEALKGSSRGKALKGFLKQIGGEGGPKTGYFQSKLLSKKQDFSGRATIYAEPNLGFNQIAVPEEMIWSQYAFHIIRDLVKKGYSYPEAKKALEARTPAAKASFSKSIAEIPIMVNRAPTLMQSNFTAHYAVPIKGKTLGINPLHLPLYAGDFDGDAMTTHVPMTPEAVEEAKKKLLPEHHIYDFRKGIGTSMVAPGHEAIIGSMYLTEPDTSKKVREFRTEEEVLAAYKAGDIDDNTPVKITGGGSR